MKVDIGILCCLGFGNGLQITYQAGIQLQGMEDTQEKKKKKNILLS